MMVEVSKLWEVVARGGRLPMHRSQLHFFFEQRGLQARRAIGTPYGGAMCGRWSCRTFEKSAQDLRLFGEVRRIVDRVERLTMPFFSEQLRGGRSHDLSGSSQGQRPPEAEGPGALRGDVREAGVRIGGAVGSRADRRPAGPCPKGRNIFQGERQTIERSPPHGGTRSGEAGARLWPGSGGPGTFTSL